MYDVATAPIPPNDADIRDLINTVVGSNKLVSVAADNGRLIIVVEVQGN